MNQEDNYTCEDCIYFIHGVNEEDVDGVAILNCSKQGMVRSWCPDFNSGNLNSLKNGKKIMWKKVRIIPILQTR